ncbi:VOC family protein [Pseudooceanicola sp. MF1-13]|uniref:VOC family protein n=1 Tax=Pseudooceanicola sp. MF1-13 TaxID=3379095 RepID=UPI003891BE5F
MIPTQAAAHDREWSRIHRRSLIKGAGAAMLTAGLAGTARAGNPLPMSAPIHVGTVGLKVRDAEAVSQWYQLAVGLREVSRDGAVIWLGAAGVPLLKLTQDDTLRLAPRTEAGLFHTAFLLPSRPDLARWINMAMDEVIPVDGVADHLVSEAIYLTDPEGNGVEIYADRPQDTWVWRDGQIDMATDPLDVDGILGSLGPMSTPWTGAPAGTVVGHVHLKVGEATKAAQWWQDTLGFDAVRARRDAVFLSTGGYHHHIAVNEWMSAGAARRSERATGLDFVELRGTNDTGAAEWVDDWGTRIRFG